MLLGAAALLVACGGGGNSNSGTLRVSLTDAQTCSYKQVFVTVDRVRVHRSATATDSASGWEELVLSPPQRVDLMTLSNGAFQALGTMPLPAGTYQQVRLVLADNGDGPEYANQLTLPNDRTAALSTPSAQQSGLKLNVHMTIEAGQTTELVLDFDPCKSVVKRGNSGKFNLKPVITAYFQEVNAIEGYTLPGAVVSAQQSGVNKKATIADPATGKFVLWPVELGTYDLVITSTGYASAVLTGVQVIADPDGSPSTTTVSTEVTPLLPPTSATHVVAGDVTTNVSSLDVIVSAVQTLDGGVTKIEVAATPINVAATDPADVNDYTLTLASGEPVRAAWAPGSTAYTFAAEAGVTGDYTIHAQAAGFVDQTQPADIGAADDLTVDFDFVAP
jgi:hypothetical protein